jgi:SH3-like domain-containing protein
MKKLAICLFVSVLLMGNTSYAKAIGGESGLPTPRFVSLKSSEVNLRSGPGVRYPVEWVYLKKRLPVEVITEFNDWRRVKDWNGDEGWVHKSLISGKRGLVVSSDTKLFYKKSLNSKAIAKIEKGVFGDLIECGKREELCKVRFSNLEGWIKRNSFWGIYSDETVED